MSQLVKFVYLSQGHIHIGEAVFDRTWDNETLRAFLRRDLRDKRGCPDATQVNIVHMEILDNGLLTSPRAQRIAEGAYDEDDYLDT